MRPDTCRVVSMLMGPLALCAAAPAAFTGLVIDHTGSFTVLDPAVSPTPQTYATCRVWAGFNDVGDRLLSVTLAQISAVGGVSLFQHPFGSATAPNSILFPFAPALPYDSYVTIGLASVPVGGTDSTALEPGSAFTGPGGTSGFQGGWFNSDPENDQGTPGAHGAPSFGTPGHSYVLIAQLTHQLPFFGGGDITGSVIVAWKAAGATSATFTSEKFGLCIPAPGALALFGAAALIARRRRW